MSEATGLELWRRCTDDERRADEDWDPASWTHGSPNRLDKHWKWLSEEARADIVKCVDDEGQNL